MPVLELNVDSLKKIDDGRIDVAFQQEIRHVIQDMQDRPGDDRDRIVTLKLVFKPLCDDRGDLESVNVKMDIGSKVPSRKTKVFDMKARNSARGPMLVFNEDSLDDMDQTTIFDQDQE